MSRVYLAIIATRQVQILCTCSFITHTCTFFVNANRSLYQRSLAAIMKKYLIKLWKCPKKIARAKNTILQETLPWQQRSFTVLLDISVRLEQIVQTRTPALPELLERKPGLLLLLIFPFVRLSSESSTSRS